MLIVLLIIASDWRTPLYKLWSKRVKVSLECNINSVNRNPVLYTSCVYRLCKQSAVYRGLSTVPYLLLLCVVLFVAVGGGGGYCPLGYYLICLSAWSILGYIRFFQVFLILGISIHWISSLINLSWKVQEFKLCLSWSLLCYIVCSYFRWTVEEL